MSDIWSEMFMKTYCIGFNDRNEFEKALDSQKVKACIDVGWADMTMVFDTEEDRNSAVKILNKNKISFSELF